MEIMLSNPAWFDLGCLRSFSSFYQKRLSLSRLIENTLNMVLKRRVSVRLTDPDNKETERHYKPLFNIADWQILLIALSADLNSFILRPPSHLILICALDLNDIV